MTAAASRLLTVTAGSQIVTVETGGAVVDRALGMVLRQQPLGAGGMRGTTAMTVVAARGTVEIGPVGGMAGVADGDRTGKLAVRNAAMLPAAARRHATAGFVKVTFETTYCRRSTPEIVPVALFARLPQTSGRGRISVESVDLFIQPRLSGRMPPGSMTVMTTVRVQSIAPIEIMAGITDRDTRGQTPVRNCPMTPATPCRRFGTIGTEMTLVATDRGRAALEICPVAGGTGVEILPGRFPMPAGLGLVEPGLTFRVGRAGVAVVTTVRPMTICAIQIMAGVTDGDIGTEGLVGRTVRPTGPGRNPTSGRPEVTAVAADSRAPPLIITAVARLAAINIIVGRRAMPVGLGLIKPGLAQGMSRCRMAIVTGGRWFEIAAIEIVALVTGGNIGGQ